MTILFSTKVRIQCKHRKRLPLTGHADRFSAAGLLAVSPAVSLQNKKRPNRRRSLNTGNYRKCGPKQVDFHSTNINYHDHYQHSPCNIYFGENFCVRLNQWFKFLTCVEDIRNGGIVMCDFTPNKSLSAMTLSDDAVKIRDVPNAGGSSVGSEVLSFEVLQKCFKAKLLKTEMEVEYFPEGGSITDYVCVVFGTKLGVSVTRARNYWGRDFTSEQAAHLLNKKLRGINQSSRNSLENWNKQVLHVWSANRDVTNVLVQAFHTLEPEVKSNTVVLITNTTTSCDFIYLNG
ncbi:AAC-rich mRNA clone AAC4 protein-like [Dreissena polymorpha]|uniref:Uncharacterized protein n=1 Tax=Dreissena polymorpha TaxID=45954 RepID=A0A9D4S4H5_DREPO|nr:AAC-rich mRNA clone AAC4 protein-like [Dreissena polymorpha]KAH3891421.1 hypothetical protein DPMN_015521 [Dreissena polymorpha]